MKQVVVVLIVVFLIVGCGNYRHQYLEWPALLVSVSDFSESQQDMVYEAVDQFNNRSGKTLIIFNDSEADSQIFIRWKEEIPQLRSAIAGRATMEPDKCTIDIAEIVASTKDYLIPVLWHEIGHCAGLEHVPEKGEIMYKEVTPLSDLETEAIERFFSDVLQATNAG